MEIQKQCLVRVVGEVEDVHERFHAIFDRALVTGD
jgi:hypothetical protein